MRRRTPVTTRATANSYAGWLWCKWVGPLLCGPFVGFLGRRGGQVLGLGRSVQGAALRPRGHRPVRAVVSALQAQLSHVFGECRTGGIAPMSVAHSERFIS